MMTETQRSAMDGITAALAEPEQADAPVAWEWRWFDSSHVTTTARQWSEWNRIVKPNPLCTINDVVNQFRDFIAQGEKYELRALYTSPQRREPLTDEQIDYIYNEHCGDGGPTAICERFARAIEAAHQIGANP